jgi:hypothetical protein
VTNAHAYIQSLKRRRIISLCFCGIDLKAQFINAHTPGVPAREPIYPQGYIELIFTFYRLFGWGMQQITGYMEDYWASHGQEIAVPSFGQLSERLARGGITPVPPAGPRCGTRQGAVQLGYIRGKGIHAFHKKYGYGVRSRIEAQISRRLCQVGEDGRALSRR